MFVLSYILTMISTVMAITMLVTKYFFLKALTIEFQTFWSFAITSYFFLFHHLLLLFIERRQNICIASLTFLRKGWWGVPDGILYRKTLIISFFKRFSERLWIKRILCLEYVTISLRILPGTLIFNLRRNKSLIGWWTI